MKEGADEDEGGKEEANERTEGRRAWASGFSHFPLVISRHQLVITINARERVVFALISKAKVFRARVISCGDNAFRLAASVVIRQSFLFPLLFPFIYRLKRVFLK